MIEFDERRWPIVTVTMRGRFGVADATAQVVAFDGLFRRGDPFGVVMVYGDERAASEEREEGANPIMTRWLKANRDLLSRWCRGIATVVPDAEQRAAMAPRLAGVDRAFGCPVTLAGSVPEAEAWLTERLGNPDDATNPRAETAPATEEDPR
jgi:hypothetical protein